MILPLKLKIYDKQKEELVKIKLENTNLKQTFNETWQVANVSTYSINHLPTGWSVWTLDALRISRSCEEQLFARRCLDKNLENSGIARNFAAASRFTKSTSTRKKQDRSLVATTPYICSICQSQKATRILVC